MSESSTGTVVEIAYLWSEELAATAAFEEWMSHGTRRLAWLVLTVLAMTVFRNSYPSWLLMGFAGFSVAVALKMITDLWVSRRRALASGTEGEPIVWRLSDQCLETQTSTTSSRVEWSHIKRLVRLRSVWLLESSGGVRGYTPVEALSDQARVALVDGVQRAGGQVV